MMWYCCGCGVDCGAAAEVAWKLHSIMPEFVAFVPGIRLAAVGKALDFERQPVAAGLLVVEQNIAWRGFGRLVRARAIERSTAVERWLAAERVLVVGNSDWPESSAFH